jgi:type I restriction enzyme, S subunit
MNINKEFMPSVANTVGTNLANYKVIQRNQFAYNNMQVGRDRTIRVARYDDLNLSIISPAYKIFHIIDTNKLNSEFLMLYFLRSEFDRLCWFYTDSSIRGSLDWHQFCDIDVPVPPIEIQTKIVKIYNFLNERIKLKEKINKNLEQLMKCIFEDWFVNFNYSEDISFKSSELGEIPSNWNVKKLSDVLITLESGKRPKGGISDIEDGIPSIGAENILGLGKFNYSKNKLISHEFFSTLKKGVIQDKDVLLYKDGAQLGRKSLFMKGFPFDICCINEHVFRLQTNDEINQFYLYLWLDQEVMTNEIINLNSNSAQPGINQNDVKSLLILVPELKIISKFNKIISPMMNQIFDNALEINKLTKLRDTLLPKLMSGEIDVSKINCDLKIIIKFILNPLNYFYGGI